MKQKHQLSYWLCGFAILVMLTGMLGSVWLGKQSGISMYPALISDAFREPQHHLMVPGAKEVKLNRTGAYGIYYEHSLVAVDHRTGLPPGITCSLTSPSSGARIAATPDYVKTNRYWAKEQGDLGVLIMSISVEQPDIYTFACDYQDGRTEPKIVVALGPNYFWEFLKIAGRIALPALGGVSLLCGSSLLALLLLATGVVLKLLKPSLMKNSKLS